MRSGFEVAAAAVVVVVTATFVNPAQARIGMFWHVTDFHYDLNYTTTGDPESMCWGKAVSGNVGTFGNYSCDAPYALVKSAVKAMLKYKSKPDFILWTGDDTAHVDDKYFSTDAVVGIVANLTNLLKNTFPNTPVIPVLGNHDYYPKNQIPVGGSVLQSAVANLWKPWFDTMGEDIYTTFNASGRYSVDIPGSNVTVVALNTLLWYKSNKHTNDLPDSNPQASDPDGQFAWIDSLLTDLTKRRRRVYLVGHIPPGTFERYQQDTKGFHWYQPRYNKRYIQLVQKHAQVIESQFFAHHHTDSFRLFFKEEEEGKERSPISYQLLSPGVTPWRSTLSEETGANNPGIRLVYYDTVTGRVTDVWTYYLNLSAANQNGLADWQLEYKFSTTYGLPSLTPQGLYKIAKDMKDDKGSIFDDYYRANTVSLEDPEVCTTKCRRLHWCAITELDYDRFYDCNPGMKASSWWVLVTLLALLLALLFH